ncbi:RHS repeat-associated core domain protein [Delftia acidovorans]|uniref:RHS repeat-associated core domain-containing protein n=1 Tax=Delftia acidovorans TaxID=80866 RepID=UPI00050424B5|nr:RHS repeat-associated core domain-containing protein [Delftia acidovorans]KFJ12528.1 RHS repeat-associated core domain protein [Delftia acidovorans]QQB48486.1 RHS repeat protein [Delftia acidovorans]
MNKPAARQGDMTKKGGPVIQGSSTVFIGSSGGVACSACPGGRAEGNPVNPVLGAKVLTAEVDLALPGPLPLHLSRDYSSYQTPTPAPVGLLGPGWWMPGELGLQASREQLIVHDGKGRSICFDPLAPGEVAYSASEHLWLVRGGRERLLGEGHPQRVAHSYLALPLELRQGRDFILATSSALGPWWVLGPERGMAAGTEAAESTDPDTATSEDPPGLDKRHVLLGLVDRFGNQLRLFRHAKGEFKGLVNFIDDGAGRRYQLELQRCSPAQEAAHGWGADAGIRLVAVHLKRDPAFGRQPPPEPLVRYEYSPHGELQAVHGRDGRIMRRFLYDPRHPGRMVGHSHAGRPTSRYTYDDQGRVIEQHNPEGLDYRFDYSAHQEPGADPASPPQASTLVTDGLGRQRLYLFTGEGGLRRIACIIEADGSRHSYRHDSAGRLVEATDPLGRQTTYRLDTASGDVTRITDSAGRTTELQYNLHGQVTRSSTPAAGNESAVHQWRYDPLGLLQEHIDPLGHSTRYHYPEPASDVRPAGAEPSPLRHLPIAVTDAKGGRQELQWDARGLLLRRQDCSGRSTRQAHDAWGNLVAIYGEEGGKLSFTYDDAARLTASINALGEVTRYGYNASGDLERIEHPDGHLEQFALDAWGRTIGYRYGAQGSFFHQRYLRDKAGRLVELHNENASIHRLRYDSQDRVVEETGFDASPRHYQYNAAGQVTASSDALHRTLHHYDERNGRLLARSISALDTEGQDAAPIATEHFDYDSAGTLTGAHHVVHGGYRLGTLFERDLLGRTLAETQQMHGPLGELLWQHRSQRQLDEMGQVTQSTITGLPPLQWLHYGPGHLHGLLLSGRNVLELERDARHREIQRRCGATTVQRAYDSLSRLTTTRLIRDTTHLRGPGAANAQAAGETASGPVLSQLNRSHQYNALGQLCGTGTAQGPWAYAYDPAGRLVQAKGPGMDQRWQYDSAGNRLFAHQQSHHAARQWSDEVRQNLHDPDFNLLQADHRDRDRSHPPCWPGNRILQDDQHQYRHDRAGNLLEKRGPQQTHRYQWDHANRLIGHAVQTNDAGHEHEGSARTDEAPTSQYFYDVFGRRIARRIPQSATPAASHPTGAGVAKGDDNATLVFYGWDGDRLTLTQLPAQNHRPMRRIHTLYEPDSHVPLLRVETAGLPPEVNLADLWEQDSGHTTDAQQRSMLAEVQKQILAGPSPQMRQTLAEFGLDADALREKLLPPAAAITHIHLYHCDHLGTPLALIDPLGKIDWHIELDPWGNCIREYNPNHLHQPIRMQGQHLDEESGLFYNRHRYYDPALGRYISRDPIGLMGGINFYEYANTNPCNAYDPLGLQAVAAQSCVYTQSTGNLTCTRDGIETVNNNGYAGAGQGRNNPDMQDVLNTGPLPRGNYTIGEAFRHRTAGIATRRLTPAPENDMQGRAGFLIHGDNATGTASEGCIVMPRTIRDSLNDGDSLEVIR